LNEQDLDELFELERCAKWIKENDYKKALHSIPC